MLARKNRLTASSDIEQVVVHGARMQTSAITVYSAPSKGGDVRFACVAGKKVHKSAVVRHAIQRKLRAACSAIITAFHGSYDIVVVARTQHVRSMSVQDIIVEITKGLPSV